MLTKLSSLAILGLFIASRAEAQYNGNNITNTIDWYPCPQNQSLPFDCGTIRVPLDYTNPNSGQYLNLSLIRVNATQQPFKGSILFNQGGPGLLGRSFFLNGQADVYLNYTSGHFDLISFDPRGTGETIPFSCYSTADERLLASIQAPFSSNASNAAPGVIWANREILAETCLRTQNQTGELIGTAFVARDMMQIVDALGEDGLLRYWGFSYGTALGATVAAMFPERMDKVVLDGVLNMHQYYAGRDTQQVASSDIAFALFLQACAAAPDRCVLARGGLSAEVLQRNIDNLLDSIKIVPPVLEGLQVVDYGIVKGIIREGLRGPSLWSSLAEALNAIFTNNVTAYIEATGRLGGLFTRPGPFLNNGTESNFGIRCGDTFLRTRNISDVLPIVAEMQSTSRYIGDVIAPPQPLTCPQWKMAAKERYAGNFQVRTRNPVLLVGSPFDPLTPLVSAQNVSSDFEGSVVLQHNGQGHCSIAQPSLCTIKSIRDYFVNGTLPAAGTRCEPDVPGYPGARDNPESISKLRARGLGRDAELLGLAQRLAEMTSIHGNVW